jgi:hypothetical protein
MLFLTMEMSMKKGSLYRIREPGMRTVFPYNRYLWNEYHSKLLAQSCKTVRDYEEQRINCN